MDNTSNFIQEYKKWSSHFKGFNFIRLLSPTWEKRLSEKQEFNIYPLFLGMFYPIILGIYPCNFFMFCLFLAAGIFQSLSLLILYFLASLVLCFTINEIYLNSLKEDFFRFQDFNPKAETPYFNITFKRLWICTILSSGLYLIYWFYRNAKIIKKAQKNNDIGFPFIRALFYPFTSNSVFKSIKLSSQIVNYPHKLNTAFCSFVIFLLSVALNWISYNSDTLLRRISYLKYIALENIVLMGIILVISLYQEAIYYYSQDINEPLVENFSVGEMIVIFLGGLITVSSLLPLIF